jgi:hypothetical protein
MGKKFITLMSQNKKYRLYSEDIKNVHQKVIRKVPGIPRYLSVCTPYDDDTEESSNSLEEQSYALN